MSAITVSSDLRMQFGPARDQGGRATCLAFAMSDTHAAVRAGAWEPLSCEYLFFQAKQRDMTPGDVGTTITAIRGALAEDGQPVEIAWPYIDVLPTDMATWKPPAMAVDLYRRTSETNGQAFDLVWRTIETGKPVVLAMTLSDAFFTPSIKGVVDTPEVKNPHMRHAVVALATGYRLNQRIILVRNSWGQSWGLSGYAWLSERYATDKISAAVTLQ